uniref:Predicted protein n=1 Tax=Hordeum vulgare subsp. vulgare TaxID=112509 RepID=F2CS34_HORVV|nr:predicted protein [Hordeum vulgare subsp. vulgare]
MPSLWRRKRAATTTPAVRTSRRMPSLGALWRRLVRALSFGRAGRGRTTMRL